MGDVQHVANLGHHPQQLFPPECHCSLLCLVYGVESLRTAGCFGNGRFCFWQQTELSGQSEQREKRDDGSL